MFSEQSYQLGDNPNDLKLVDVNGDGILDTVSGDRTDDTLSILIGNGDGTFQDRYTVNTGQFPTTVDAADLNNDGVIDLVATNFDDDTLSILIGEVTDGVAPLLEFSLTSVADAKQALSQFTQKLVQLTEQRGQIGAFESRLQSAESVLNVTAANFIEAESRIRDADVAAEAAELVRLQILQRATAAVLAQANGQPALVLQLFDNT